MYEELLHEDKIHSEQIYPRIYIEKTKEIDKDAISELINNFEVIGKTQLRKLL